MREVAALSFRVVLEGASRLGISRERILCHSPLKDEILRGARRRYPWSDYVAMLEEFAVALGGYEALSKAGEMMPDLAPEGSALFGSFVSPSALYRFVMLVVVGH